MKRILFFDDEPFITKLLIDNLQNNHGWSKDNLGEITFVSKPEDVIGKAKKTIYDLFVLDIMVPIDQIGKDIFTYEEIGRMQNGDNTGVVIAEKIRSMNNYDKVPILFLSARIQPSQKMDNTDYIEKPAFASVVSEKMKTLLRH